MPPDNQQDNKKPDTETENEIDVDSVVSKNKQSSGKGTWLKPLRTYKSDVEEALKKQGGSLTRLIIAEQKKRRGLERREVGIIENPKEKLPTSSVEKAPGKLSAKNVSENVTPKIKAERSKQHMRTGSFKKMATLVVAVVSFIILVGALSYAGFLLFKDRDTNEQFIISEGIIYTDKQKQISLSSLSGSEIKESVAEEIKNANLKVGNIEHIFFTKTLPDIDINEDVTGGQRVGLIGIRELFFIIKNNMPSNLLRALDKQDFLFGIHSLANNKPFIIIKIDSFENAFSGMLAWERFMLEDLADLFALDISLYRFTNRIFTDDVLKERDVRILRDDTNQILLIYSFVDRDTLIITMQESTFNEVLIRLKSPKRIIR